jgi:CheY-like chemotaxis protein
MSHLKPILLVEDNANDVELTLEALREVRVANPVEVARDGVEALDYLRLQARFATRKPGNPAMILLDLKLPRVDGLQVLREVKSDPLLKMVPVIMLTSSREESDLVTSYDIGVNAYVVKPVDFEQFTDAVRRIGAFWAVLNEPSPEPVSPH